MCELCGVEVEDLAHILLPKCPTLMDRKGPLVDYCKLVFSNNKVCQDIFENILKEKDQATKVQFLVDCSVLPVVIKAAQVDEKILTTLFKATRTWCYTMHRSRLKLLGQW